jgi:hypothetical protein
LVEGFGRLVLILGCGAGLLLLIGAVDLKLEPAIRTLVAGVITLRSLSCGALMLAVAKAGHIACDMADDSRN